MNLLFYLLFIVVNCDAHIFMRSPPSRRSQYSSYYTSQNLVNYDLNAPLNMNVGGSFFTFPCKGFPKGPATAQINGNTISVTLEGTATHGGGHCQFGISFDDTNFLVLRTVMDNCLISSMSYTFTVPPSMPNGDVTVFWTWVNAIGNREYYMECADVNVNNGNKNRNVILHGKELLVVNLPGYPSIPEFPNKGMYSGHDLFEARKDFSVSPVGFLPKPSEVPKPKEPVCDNVCNYNDTLSTTSRIGQSNPSIITVFTTLPTDRASRRSCSPGSMRCQGDDTFEMCDHDDWVSFSCAPGTKCVQSGNLILCDFK